MKLFKMVATVCAASLITLAQAGAPIFKTAMVENEDAFKAGKEAAEELKTAMGEQAPKAILAMECFEEEAQKKAVINGIASVFPKEIIFGGAVYATYTQKGALDVDTVSLLGIAGDIEIDTAFVENMGAAGLSMETQKDQLAAALKAGGTKLAQQIPAIEKSSLVLVMADAHSPKNAFLLDGIHEVAGKKLPITGGSICKNAGQTFVFYKGAMYKDSAFALALKGDIKLAQAGRQAKSNDLVISTAAEGTAAAVKELGTKPSAMIAFDCAGRMGKLDNLEDEVAAIKKTIGTDVPIFGCYCAGEFGKMETAGETSGQGWHIMINVFGK